MKKTEKDEVEEIKEKPTKKSDKKVETKKNTSDVLTK